MFHENLVTLRKLHHMTQEELAEKLGVSRQALAKWEAGETLPDIEKTRRLAEIFGVSLDEIVNYSAASSGLPIPPKGKHIFGVVTLGDKGQIVIPGQARKIFGLQSGDRLIVLGDDNQGIALVKESDFLQMAEAIRRASEA